MALRSSLVGYGLCFWAAEAAVDSKPAAASAADPVPRNLRRENMSFVASSFMTVFPFRTQVTLLYDRYFLPSPKQTGVRYPGAAFFQFPDVLQSKVPNQTNRGLSALPIPFHLRDRHIQTAPYSWQLRNDYASVHANRGSGSGLFLKSD